MHELSKEQARRMAVPAAAARRAAAGGLLEVVDTDPVAVDPTAAIAPSADLVRGVGSARSYPPADLGRRWRRTDVFERER